MIISWILYILVAFFVLISYIPRLRNPHWGFRSWGFIRVQTLVAQLILLPLLLMWGSFRESVHWTFVGLLGLTILYQLYLVLPFTSFYPSKQKFPKKDSYHRASLKLFTANVLQDNDRTDEFISIVKRYDPDVVLAMETDRAWEKALDQLESTYPHQVKVPLDNYYGMHVYSKLSLSDTKTEYRVEPDVPSITTTVHLDGGIKLRLYCVHPAPPSPTENETSKERDAELMLIGKEVREEDLPIVVCGDMNDVVWSRVSRLFKKMTNMIDPRIGRGLFPTFHAGYKLLRFPLDHLFHTSNIYVDKMERGPYYGSDHFPMYYEMSVQAKTTTDNEPELEEEEEEEIEERIQDGFESVQNKPALSS
ncbi:endonuclease/exonuclease/phosphatase family protein [Croceiramulus getboli]|nr:endonuclease/exonuclease/phosphatase family protein [Flavobacteriaceae bacterium YJPT1-3]